MNEFIYLTSVKMRNLSCEIIRNFSILIVNIKNPTTLYFIFSNNFINQIISQDYDGNDYEFVCYYINFIKSLAQKIDLNTLQFFFQEQYNSFQLLQCSLKYYNHSDSMVRTTVRNIVLTFMKCNINYS
jgi:protein CLEC16A